MGKRDFRKMLAKLKRAGFDRSYKIGGSIQVRCSQCEALVINGIATHETGCPNNMKRR